MKSHLRAKVYSNHYKRECEATKRSDIKFSAITRLIELLSFKTFFSWAFYSSERYIKYHLFFFLKEKQENWTNVVSFYASVRMKDIRLCKCPWSDERSSDKGLPRRATILTLVALGERSDTILIKTPSTEYRLYRFTDVFADVLNNKPEMTRLCIVAPCQTVA